jgi:hypothetical protein
MKTFVHHSGKDACTKYVCIDTFKIPYATSNSNKTNEECMWYSLVLCQPVTGRTHQIRAHMAHLEHPILGDFKYYSNKDVRHHKSGMLLETDHLMLHSYALTLPLMYESVNQDEISSDHAMRSNMSDQNRTLIAPISEYFDRDVLKWLSVHDTSPAKIMRPQYNTSTNILLGENYANNVDPSNENVSIELSHYYKSEFLHNSIIANIFK